MADWGNLPKDIVTKIAEHLDFYEDFETMSKICSPWRSAAKEAKLRACNNGIESHTLPWLMLPERDESLNIRRFYSISKDMIRSVNLLADDDDGSKKRLLSSHGWLLVISERDNKLSLFNPYSRAIIKLPEIKNYPHHFILSADPSTTSNFIVFLTCKSNTYSYTVLVTWRNGDDVWTQLMPPSVVPELEPDPAYFLKYYCRDVTFYQGEFFGVNADGLIVKFETSSHGNSFQVVGQLSMESMSGGENGSDEDVDIKWYYNLVVSGGQLLVVRMEIKYEVKFSNNGRETTMHPTRFKVFELDVNNRYLKQVLNLGDRAIFIGFNSSFSAPVHVSSSGQGHGLKPNCIYHADVFKQTVFKGPAPGGKNHCVYNLNKNDFDSFFYTGPSLDNIGTFSQLLWVESPK